MASKGGKALLAAMRHAPIFADSTTNEQRRQPRLQCGRAFRIWLLGVAVTLAGSCTPAVQLEVQSGDGPDEGQVLPTCDLGDGLTFTIRSDHCALKGGLTFSVVIGQGLDSFGHSGTRTAELAIGEEHVVFVPLDFRDSFYGDNVEITVHTNCADGRTLGGKFRCRAPLRDRLLPT